MASTYTLDATIKLTGKEILDTTDAPAASSESERTIKTGNLGLSGSYSASTSPGPKIESPLVSQKLTMTGSAVTIDLTAVQAVALPVGATRAVDMTGKKVVGWLIKCPETNAAVVTVAKGAANGYAILGSSGTIDVTPGETVAGCLNNKASSKPAVSSTVKNIAVTGQAGDICYVELYLGT